VIIKKIEVGPFASNCYIVASKNNKEGMIIDPGDEAGRIMEEVKREGLDIKMVVMTHGHLDHTAALKEVKEATGASIAIHKDEVKILNNKFVSIFLGMRYRTPPDAERLLEDGDVISVGEMEFRVIHTPGHTPGGICLLGEGVLFSGDTLFFSSVGRSDIPTSGGSHHQLIQSIKEKLLTLDDDIKVYPGHGPETTIGAERRGNPFLV